MPGKITLSLSEDAIADEVHSIITRAAREFNYADFIREMAADVVKEQVKRTLSFETIREMAARIVREELKVHIYDALRHELEPLQINISMKPEAQKKLEDVTK